MTASAAIRRGYCIMPKSNVAQRSFVDVAVELYHFRDYGRFEQGKIRHRRRHESNVIRFNSGSIFGSGDTGS